MADERTLEQMAEDVETAYSVALGNRSAKEAADVAAANAATLLEESRANLQARKEELIAGISARTV